MTSSPSSSLRFSLPDAVFRTTPNISTSAIPTKPKKNTFLQWNQLSPFHFHLFPSFRNTIGQEHEANLRVACSVKTLQYRVRKCVHESKPRATRSRVNPITVQCKLGKWRQFSITPKCPNTDCAMTKIYLWECTTQGWIKTVSTWPFEELCFGILSIEAVKVGVYYLGAAVCFLKTLHTA